MPIEQVIILAVVQGITEFLPISSTAHLVLVPWLLGWKDPGLEFDIALHVGTLAAVLVYFASTWIRILQAAAGKRVLISEEEKPGEELSEEEFRRERLLLWFLILATIPAAIAGVLLHKQAEAGFRTPWIMGSTLILVALLMLWAEKVSGLRKRLSGITLVDALFIGLAQAFAVIPGVSRSGSTIAAGLGRDLRREAAARFSFLLSTPIIAGAALVEGHKLLKTGIAPEMRMPFVVGILVSAVVGYAVIFAFIRYLRTQTLTIFIVYRIIFGIMILALAYFGRYH